MDAVDGLEGRISYRPARHDGDGVSFQRSAEYHHPNHRDFRGRLRNGVEVLQLPDDCAGNPCGCVVQDPRYRGARKATRAKPADNPNKNPLMEPTSGYLKAS